MHTDSQYPSRLDILPMLYNIYHINHNIDINKLFKTVKMYEYKKAVKKTEGEIDEHFASILFLTCIFHSLYQQNS